MQNNDILTELGAMQAHFSTKLPSRLAALDAALQACRDQPSMSEHVVELHRLLHSLAGAAGTFGFDALGLQAREFEQQVEQWLIKQTWVSRDVDRLALLLPQLQVHLEHLPLDVLPQPDLNNQE